MDKGVEGQFPHLDKIPAIYLGMFGVHSDYMRVGIGLLMMIHAFSTIVEIADRAGLWALTLDAVDEEAALYYERYNFQRFTADGLHMFLPLAGIMNSENKLNKMLAKVGYQA